MSGNPPSKNTDPDWTAIIIGAIILIILLAAA